MELSKFVFKRLLGQYNVEDFSFTIEKGDDSNYISIITLKDKNLRRETVLFHLLEEDFKIGYNDVTEDKICELILPKYYQIFLENRISSATPFDKGELIRMYVCTNLSLNDNLGDILKDYAKNDSFFTRYDTLRKLKLSDYHIRRLFQARREKIAKELVENFMLASHTTDPMPPLKNEDASGLLKDHRETKLPRVIDRQTGGFSKEFLAVASNGGEGAKLLAEIWTALSKFYKNFGGLSEEELQDKFSIDLWNAKELKVRLEHYNTRESNVTFLEKQKFNIQLFSNVSKELTSTLPPDELFDQDKEIDCFLDNLIFVTGIRDFKSLLQNEMSPDLFKRFNEKFNGWYEERTRIDQNVQDSNKWLTKRQIYDNAMKKVVNFQGQEMKLQHLVGESKGWPTQNLLLRLYSFDEFVVGCNPLREQEICINYMPRTLIANDESKMSYEEKDLIREQNKRMYVIVGEPGAGKSTFIEHVVHILGGKKDEKEPKWMIKIPLRTCRNELVYLNPTKLKDIIAFIAKVEKCDDPLSRSLLEEFLMVRKSVRIFLDGIDELIAENQQKIFQLIRFLKDKSSVDQIWVTTRPHLQQKLEDSFNESSFTLKELTVDEQVTMLVQHWSHDNAQKNEAKLISFAQKSIKTLNLIIGQRWLGFLGLPMQTFLFGFILRDEIKNEEMEIPMILSLDTLYTKFIEKKFQVFFRGKRYQDKDGSQRKLNQLYQHLALKNKWLILREVQKMPLPSEEEKNTLLEIGLIYEKGNDIYFIHQTFQEYFSAEYAVNLAKSERNKNVKDCNFFISHFKAGIFAEETKFDLLMFDLKAAVDSPLHMAILNQENEKIQNFSQEEIEHVDCLGRSILHYAIRFAQYHTLEILMKKIIQGNQVESLYNEFFQIYDIHIKSFIWSINNWDDSFIPRLATYAKFYTYLFENKDIIAEKINQSDSKLWFLDSINYLIDETKNTFQELAANFNDIELYSLPSKIMEFTDKEIPLRTAHRYFIKNGPYLLNSNKKELAQVFKSLEFNKQAKILSISQTTAHKITFNLFDSIISSFKINNKLPSSIHKECIFDNFLLILTEFDSRQIPVFIPTKYDLVKLFSNYAHYFNSNLSPRQLKKMADQGKVEKFKGIIINDIWKTIQEHKIYEIIEKQLDLAALVMHLIKFTTFGKLVNLYNKCDDEICRLNKTKLYYHLKEADEHKWLRIILNAKTKYGKKLEHHPDLRYCYKSDDVTHIAEWEAKANSIRNLLTTVREKVFE